MRVFLNPSIALHSPAMVRIANALTKYLPPHYKVVSQMEQADLCVFYPISYDWTHYLAECIAQDKEYALIQCCYKSGREEEDKLQFQLWKSWWDKAIIVWSYLDLWEDKKQWMASNFNMNGKFVKSSGPVGLGFTLDKSDEFNFYEAPLGIDEAFLLPTLTHPKRDYIVTTGTVHGKGAEAILECWEAAKQSDLKIVHVGQWPENISTGATENLSYWRWKQTVNLVIGCTDQTLCGIYQNARYVCSLRYVEGFELPALEALSCGARSIVFTQPATTKWYWGYADFVPECEGEELVNHLVGKFSGPYEPISQPIIDEVRSKFNWSILCWRFWSIVEKEVGMRRQVKRVIR